MKGALALRKPVETLTLNLASTNITTSAWAEILALTTAACSAIEIFNPSGSTLMFSQGAAGQETIGTNLFPLSVLPGGTPGIIPIEIGKGKRLSMKAVDTTVSSGYLVINFYG